MDTTHVDLKKLLDEIPVAITYTDSKGIILYRNRTAAKRPSPGPRDIGIDIKICHALPESRKKIDLIFDDFIKGRRTPHHYVSQRTGIRELVTLIPVFTAEHFTGCLQVVHPLEVPGEIRTF